MQPDIKRLFADISAAFAVPNCPFRKGVRIGAQTLTFTDFFLSFIVRSWAFFLAPVPADLPLSRSVCIFF